MIQPSRKKAISRILMFGFLAAMIVGMIPHGTAFFWNKKDEPADTPEVVETAAAGNKAPVAQNLSFETYSNITVAGKLKAVDPEGEAVTFKIVEKPRLGEAVVEGAGFRYVPYQNKSGSDFFMYAAVDAAGNVSASAKVEINVKKRASKTTVAYADMDGHPSHYAAIRLSECNVFSGEKVGNSYFLHPTRAVTRNEFVAMAVAAAGLDVPAAAINTGFLDDESTDAWAKPYIASALAAGFISGSGDAAGNVSFRGADPITRAEAAVIVNKLAALTDETSEVFYPDAAEIPAWAVQATANVDAVDIMNGYTDGTIRPNAVVTRAEAVQLIYNSMRLKDSRKETTLTFWVSAK